MISAYDLARDICDELAENPEAVDFDCEDESAEYSQDAVLLVEKMTRDALRNGGIAQ